MEERAALWRDQVASSPLLLVLDDAAGSDQVRPLLPGSGGSLVLVTSRRHLTGDQQRLFRRLGLHPGADIDAYAAAALDGVDLPPARRALEALYDRCLLAEPAQGRYRLHDLIREYARTLAGRADSSDERDAAMSRLLDYYQRTAAIADARLARGQRPGRTANGGGMPAAVPVLADRAEALAWVRVERASLLGCLDHAAAGGQHDRVIALTAGVSTLLLRDGPWADAIARHTAAIRAAHQLGDQLSLAGLGRCALADGDAARAGTLLRQALEIFQRIGAAEAAELPAELAALADPPLT